ncbi:FAD-dependent oxidoreductase [Pseudogemmobacter humi]|uniref:6-hydroxynicotinate 3-monooxygenase n=1 Tax=Pseudogemmobacter humi TaxID=2483812 RepID=A0A3P5XTB2_9RHOB|nr:NAD(P)/FAD-dependent oxidoreductase [Pseudogemmobacter humi]VDC33612.1 6-hydroxynicotinate 3-monooxygenase precursor [Pseudogemmobacter humi]
MHVEIAGGGIGGLTAAAALAQRGHSVTVHERNPELREIGAGLFVWENALRTLEALGAYEEVAATSEWNQNWQIRDHRNRLLQSDWLMKDSRLITAERQTLHMALANQAIRAGVEIRTSSEVVSATPAGELELADGSRRKADLVLGVEGVTSRIRDLLPGRKQVVRLRDGGARYLIRRREDDHEVKNSSIECWSGGRRVGVIPVSPEHIYLYLCCPVADTRGARTPPDIDSWVRSFPQLETYLRRLEDNGKYVEFRDIRCENWHHGRMAILGDAAHAMSPNLGQAACITVQSAYLLARCVHEAPSIDQGLRDWETKFRPVAEATQRLSRFYGRVGTRWPVLLQDARSLMVAAMGRSARLQHRINVAVRTDVTAPVPVL